MTPLDRLIDKAARELARLSYVREFGAVRAKAWSADVDAYVDLRLPFYIVPARELVGAILPYVLAVTTGVEVDEAEALERFARADMSLRAARAMAGVLAA